MRDHKALQNNDRGLRGVLLLKPAACILLAFWSGNGIILLTHPFGSRNSSRVITSFSSYYTSYKVDIFKGKEMSKVNLETC